MTEEVTRNSPLVEDPGCSSSADISADASANVSAEISADTAAPMESITLDSVSDSMPTAASNARPLTLRIYRASAPKEPHVQAEITVGENLDVHSCNANNLPVGFSIRLKIEISFD